MTLSADARALLNAVVASPDDDTPRLVYADWLDENGQSARAELIRGQIAVHQNPKSPHALAWLRREKQLLRQHKDQWLRELPRAKGMYWGDFVRGFPDEVTLQLGMIQTLPPWDESGGRGEVFDLCPLVALGASGSKSKDLRTLLAWPGLTRFEQFRWVPSPVYGRREDRLTALLNPLLEHPWGDRPRVVKLVLAPTRGLDEALTHFFEELSNPFPILDIRNNPIDPHMADHIRMCFGDQVLL